VPGSMAKALKRLGDMWGEEFLFLPIPPVNNDMVPERHRPYDGDVGVPAAWTDRHLDIFQGRIPRCLLGQPLERMGFEQHALVGHVEGAGNLPGILRAPVCHRVPLDTLVLVKPVMKMHRESLPLRAPF